MIQRDSMEDAERLVERFLPERSHRQIILNFLSDGIEYSNDSASSNWSLNMDKDGGFIRFNIGQVYCITIYKNESLVLCLRNKLKRDLKSREVPIDFAGYERKREVRSSALNKVPDCLVKVPGSVGCYFKHEDAEECIGIIKRSNRAFIDYAIKHTNVLPKMRNAHSVGFIEYLSKAMKKDIPNPLYLLTEEEYYRLQEELSDKAKGLPLQELEEKCLKKRGASRKIKVTTIQYVRDPYISELAKRKAKGICQDCKEPAPFLNKLTQEPYLESHHIKPLWEGGLDTIENVVALCPNCHKRRHYG